MRPEIPYSGFTSLSGRIIADRVGITGSLWITESHYRSYAITFIDAIIVNASIVDSEILRCTRRIGCGIYILLTSALIDKVLDIGECESVRIGVLGV